MPVWFSTTFVLVLTLKTCGQTQPLFSLHEYDKQECDSSAISHTIIHDDHAATASSRPWTPLLKFNPSFVINTLVPDDIRHSNAIVVVDPHNLVRANVELQLRLLSLIHDGHVVAIQTDALAHLDGDFGPEQELMGDVAAFETLSGIILPFYVSLIDKSNITVPLFRLKIPSSDPLQPTRAYVLEDDAALNFIRNNTHNSHTKSVLDLLDQQQLVCLLSRLQCHRAVPTDLIFQLCLQSARRLNALTRTLPSLMRFRPLLRYIADNGYEEERGTFVKRMKPTFDDVTSQVKKAYGLLVDGASEVRVRSALTHPHYQANKGEVIRLQQNVYLPSLILNSLPLINHSILVICILVAVVELIVRCKLLPQVRQILKYVLTTPWTCQNVSRMAGDRAKIF